MNTSLLGVHCWSDNEELLFRFERLIKWNQSKFVFASILSSHNVHTNFITYMLGDLSNSVRSGEWMFTCSILNYRKAMELTHFARTFLSEYDAFIPIKSKSSVYFFSFSFFLFSKLGKLAWRYPVNWRSACKRLDCSMARNQQCIKTKNKIGNKKHIFNELT